MRVESPVMRNHHAGFGGGRRDDLAANREASPRLPNYVDASVDPETLTHSQAALAKAGSIIRDGTLPWTFHSALWRIAGNSLKK